MSKPIHVTDAEFTKEVLRSELPVLVDFWAPWCGPCRMVAPSLETLASEYAGRIRVAKVNTDDHPLWASQYGVQGIPTLLFVADGEEIGRLIGAYPLPVLRQAVEQVLAWMAEHKDGHREREGEAGNGK